MKLENKIDFAVLFTVNGANPNGNPLGDNYPRMDSHGRGEMTDVSIKRKIRNTLLDNGLSILIQSDDYNVDGLRSVKERLETIEEIKKVINKGNPTYEEINRVKKLACETWYDVRAFGQVIALKAKKDNEKGSSIGIRGPVTINIAKSVNPITVNHMQITKSVNNETENKKGSDTMGMKYVVEFGLYVAYGSISPLFAERNGFTKEDAEWIKYALIHMFDNDASAARPAGSMQVRRLYWWEHNGKMGDSRKTYETLKIEQIVENPTKFEDFKIDHEELEGVKTEVLSF